MNEIPFIATFIAYQRDFDAHDAQHFFATHWTLPLTTVALYLFLVWYGQRLMEYRSPFELRRVSFVWNILVALFSVCGSIACVPHLLAQWHVHGFWYTACSDVYELAGSGAPALWATLFTWSKLFELFDTALLVLKKRQVITLHWFHHASVILFVWAGWTFETPCALWYGAMNYSVHALMYSYFACTAHQRWRPIVLRLAPAITSLQISQFAFGTFINGFAAFSYFSPSIGCAIKPPILWISAALYIAYGCLFVHLFVRRYCSERNLRGAEVTVKAD